MTNKNIFRELLGVLGVATAIILYHYLWNINTCLGEVGMIILWFTIFSFMEFKE
jgi:hypothetical protein